MNNKQASFGAKLTAAQAALTLILFLVGGFSVYTIVSLRGALESTANREAAKSGLLAEMETRVAKLTAASCTPSSFFRLRSTRAAQAAQVIPRTGNWSPTLAPGPEGFCVSGDAIGGVYARAAPVNR